MSDLQGQLQELSIPRAIAVTFGGTVYIYTYCTVQDTQIGIIVFDGGCFSTSVIGEYAA